MAVLVWPFGSALGQRDVSSILRGGRVGNDEMGLAVSDSRSPLPLNFFMYCLLSTL